MGKKFADQMRREIDKCGMSRYEISKRTGITQAQLSKFRHGKAGLSIEGIEAICDLLGLRLTADKPKQKAR